jgi:CO2 hydration protein
MSITAPPMSPTTHPKVNYETTVTAEDVAAVRQRLIAGGALLPDSPGNVMEVVGILKSYGVVLDNYWRTLTYTSQTQFLVLLPFFKFFRDGLSLPQLAKHLWHDRINYEFAEYCMKAMMWHGGGGLDAFLDSDTFRQLANEAIKARVKYNPLMATLHKLFPDFLLEQTRQMAYYSALGFFWSFMAPLFLDLSDRYDRGEIKTIRDVVLHVQKGLVDAAAAPFTYSVTIGGKSYPIVPQSANLSFLMDTAVPYVEAVFFRSFPFRGTVSYNAQDTPISRDLENFNYGVLYADPLPVGGAGIPPTLLMQDMRHFLPEYLLDYYLNTTRGMKDLRVKICISFQKSMFCVTTAALRGLAPHPLDSLDPEHQAANKPFLDYWLERLENSRLPEIQDLEITTR